MAQKVAGYIKLQIPAGKATPAPPVGPALGQHGVNIMQFAKELNEKTAKDAGLIIPVKKACKIESGSGVPNKTKVATISKADLQAIAEQKMPDLNAASVEAAMSMIAGTCRSMGVLIGD